MSVAQEDENLEADRDTANRDKSTLQNGAISVLLTMKSHNGVTYVAIVLAAHGLSGAAATRADADDGDRRAGDTEEDIHVLDNNTQKAQEGSTSCRTSLFKPR